MKKLTTLQIDAIVDEVVDRLKIMPFKPTKEQQKDIAEYERLNKEYNKVDKEYNAKLHDVERAMNTLIRKNEGKGFYVYGRSNKLVFTPMVGRSLIKRKLVLETMTPVKDYESIIERLIESFR